MGMICDPCFWMAQSQPRSTCPAWREATECHRAGAASLEGQQESDTQFGFLLPKNWELRFIAGSTLYFRSRSVMVMVHQSIKQDFEKHCATFCELRIVVSLLPLTRQRACQPLCPLLPLLHGAGSPVSSSLPRDVCISWLGKVIPLSVEYSYSIPHNFRTTIYLTAKY